MAAMLFVHGPWPMAHGSRLTARPVPSRPGPATPSGPGLLRPLFLYAGSANPGRWAWPDFLVVRMHSVSIAAMGRPYGGGAWMARKSRVACNIARRPTSSAASSGAYSGEWLIGAAVGSVPAGVVPTKK